MMSVADCRHRLIAIMLGRLRMSVEDCIIEYENLARKIFERYSNSIINGAVQLKRVKFTGARHDSSILEDAFKEFVGNWVADKDRNAKLLEDGGPCKV